MQNAQALSPTRLRENIYSVLDAVLLSGEAISINRKGRTVWLVAGTDGPHFTAAANARRNGIGDTPVNVGSTPMSVDSTPANEPTSSTTHENATEHSKDEALQLRVSRNTSTRTSAGRRAIAPKGSVTNDSPREVPAAKRSDGDAS